MTKPEVVHTGVRQGHQARILRLLNAHGALSRADLAQRAGLSRVSLAGLSTELISAGAVVVLPPEETTNQGRGRPAERLALNPRSGTLLGVEFGHRRIHVAVVNAAHEVVIDGAVRHDEDLAWDARVAKSFELLDALSADAGIHMNHMAGVGVGVVGPVGRSNSDAVPRPDGRFALSAETITAVSAAFTDRFGTTVFVENNARLAALAEASWDSGTSASDLLYVRISEGVGGGLVVDGRLVSGSFGLAGQLGHVTVRPDGIMCRCGKRGCLETVASVPALIRACREVRPSIQTITDIAEMVASGDQAVRACLVSAGEALGGVLATVAVSLNPSEIVFAGDLMAHDQVVFEAARATFATQIPPINGYLPTIRPGRLGDGDGALGAVIAAFRRSPLLAAYADVTGIDQN